MNIELKEIDEKFVTINDIDAGCVFCTQESYLNIKTTDLLMKLNALQAVRLHNGKVENINDSEKILPLEDSYLVVPIVK